MREKEPTPLPLFECHCALRHKPITRFGSTNTLWPECDRGGVISCTGWHTSLSCLGLCTVTTVQPRQSAQHGRKTSSPHEVCSYMGRRVPPSLTHKYVLDKHVYAHMCAQGKSWGLFGLIVLRVQTCGRSEGCIYCMLLCADVISWYS